MRIHSLKIHPLSGARGVDVASGFLFPGGLSFEHMRDREFVCHNPDTGQRISSKPNQAPRLAKVAADVGGGVLALSLFSDEDPNGRPVDEREFPVVSVDNFKLATQIDEFGDHTRVFDMGDEIAGYLSDFLNIPVRVGQKTPDYLDAPFEEVALRNVAGLHITTLETLRNLADILVPAEDRSHHDIDDIQAQLRAGMLIEFDDLGANYETWPEVEWAANHDRLVCGPYPNCIEILRPTGRCPVPGRDANTGQRADINIPLAYRSMPSMQRRKLDGTVKDVPVIGVYGASRSVFEVYEGAPIAFAKGSIEAA